MDETSIKRLISQLDEHRDDLVIALHYYEVEKRLIPKGEAKIAETKTGVQHALNNLKFDIRRLLKEGEMGRFRGWLEDDEEEYYEHKRAEGDIRKGGKVK